MKLIDCCEIGRLQVVEVFARTTQALGDLLGQAAAAIMGPLPLQSYPIPSKTQSAEFRSCNPMQLELFRGGHEDRA